LLNKADVVSSRRAPEQVSLRQAVLWIAFGLELCEERFEAMEGYPRTVDGDDPQHPLTKDQKRRIQETKIESGWNT
jgi:hypothetical protein